MRGTPLTEMSPFRTDNNQDYLWPPRTAPHFDVNNITLFDRVTHLISEGCPQPWRKPYERREMAQLLVDHAGDIINWSVRAMAEKPETFSLDQDWWNQQLNKAHQWDVDQAQKVQDWKDGLLPWLKSRPSPPTKVKALLRLPASSKFFMWFKQATDRHSNNAAQLGTNAHAYAEAVAAGTPIADILEMVQANEVLVHHERNISDFFINWRPEFIEIESVIYNRSYGYAGQFDGIVKIPVSVMKTKEVWDAELQKMVPWTDKRQQIGVAYAHLDNPNYDPDHIVVWMDWKTKVKDNIGLQLCAYANAEFIGREDGTEDPLPHVDEFWGVEFGDSKGLRVWPVTLPPFSDYIAVAHVAQSWIATNSSLVLTRPLKEIEAA